MKYDNGNGNGCCKLKCIKCGELNMVPRHQVIPGLIECRACGWKVFQLVNSKKRKFNGQAQASL